MPIVKGRRSMVLVGDDGRDGTIMFMIEIGLFIEEHVDRRASISQSMLMR